MKPSVFLLCCFYHIEERKRAKNPNIKNRSVEMLLIDLAYIGDDKKAVIASEASLGDLDFFSVHSLILKRKIPLLNICSQVFIQRFAQNQ